LIKIAEKFDGVISIDQPLPNDCKPCANQLEKQVLVGMAEFAAGTE